MVAVAGMTMVTVAGMNITMIVATAMTTTTRHYWVFENHHKEFDEE